ncbi:hypothetical protein AMECASPLE_001749 [Ameca splendens]|uniref:Uncharacterized protein n=1 Tax=Ameca splendens TaxID=208324 RepID=A0ABV0XA34_9TELE
MPPLAGRGPGVESSSFFIIASLHPPVRDNYLKGFKPARNPPVGGWHLRTEPPRTAVSSPVAAEEGKEGCCFTSGYIYGVSIERGKVGSHVRESGEGRRPAHLVQAGRDTRTQTRSVALLASPLSVYYRRGRATCAPGWCEVRQSGFSDASFSDTPSTRRFRAPCVIALGGMFRRAVAEQSAQLLSYHQCQEKVRINNGKTPGKYQLSHPAATGLCGASLSEELAGKGKLWVVTPVAEHPS